MEVLILIIIFLLILTYTTFNFKINFVINNKEVTFSVREHTTSESSESS
ncbi:hypothetical protein [Acidianus bottle-shaped virus]|uniref:Uncharacterized protein ORF48b n=1 Tax=Acidianus bottle-shaped virus (isolate Italy/Pozzuoli) TaxID=654911 RepID=Y048B_ABVP|nr:hypothetical protein ABV_gp47 [Acidianus bottle-shaped virus]A4ZUD3.1 RecName: Full=Uncharacterized protein ORF48b [Acidianus bottle-shaped virus (isolate Pozzuoli)]ABP73437.1 hypothetical protein [Acidianus bottle-shaped virus]